MTHQADHEFVSLSEALDELVLRAAAIQLVQAAERSLACQETQADDASEPTGFRAELS